MSGYFQRQAEEQEGETERLAQVDAELEATDAMLQAKCREVDALIEERTRIRAELAKLQTEYSILFDQLVIIGKEDVCFFKHARLFPGRFAEMALGVLPRAKVQEIEAYHHALFEQWLAVKTLE